ncbi:hypothetical protein HZB88_01075 [archaeon]|nr:hypothetical protein [archaeon]
MIKKQWLTFAVIFLVLFLYFGISGMFALYSAENLSPFASEEASFWFMLKVLLYGTLAVIFFCLAVGFSVSSSLEKKE